MPRSGKRSILQVQRKEISANTLQSKEYRLSITNWLAGSEPLIPVSNSRIARRICAFATDDKSPLVESEDAGYESTAEDSSESSDYTSDAPSAGGWSSAGGSLVAFDDASSGQSGSGSITSGGGASIPRIRCLKAAQYLPKNKGLTATKKKTKEKFEDTKVSTETLGSTPEGNNNDEKPTKETVNICSTRGINGTDNAAFQQEWTISEDAMMVSMRAGGETWLSIAAALGRAEEQVMERWCALVNRIATPGYTTLDRAEWTARAVTKTGNDADNELSEVYEKSRKPNKVKSGECGMNKTDGNCDCNSRKGEKPKDKDQVMTQNHKKLRKREATGSALLQCSAHPTSPDDDVAACKQQQAAAATGLLSRLHPEELLNPTNEAQNENHANSPHELWARDCKILGLLSAKQKVNRWLNLQADFGNATGRMVSVELLRRGLSSFQHEAVPTK